MQKSFVFVALPMRCRSFATSTRAHARGTGLARTDLSSVIARAGIAPPQNRGHRFIRSHHAREWAFGSGSARRTNAAGVSATSRNWLSLSHFCGVPASPRARPIRPALAPSTPSGAGFPFQGFLVADHGTVIGFKLAQKGGFRGGLKLARRSQTPEKPAFLSEKWCC